MHASFLFKSPLIKRTLHCSQRCFVKPGTCHVGKKKSFSSVPQTIWGMKYLSRNAIPALSWSLTFSPQGSLSYNENILICGDKGILKRVLSRLLIMLLLRNYIENDKAILGWKRNSTRWAKKSTLTKPGKGHIKENLS